MAEDLEAEDFELKEYSFTPSVFDKNGKKVIDYTGIEHNKVYLVNRKDILTNPRPSWIPEFDKDGLIADDFLPVCVKDSDGYYYVQSKLEKKDEVIEKAGGRSHKREEWECRYYKMSLDLLSATIDYYLKYRREELRKQQYDARVSLPRSQKTITINRYYDIAELLRFCDKYKDEIDVLTEKYKSQSFYNKGYVRQNQVIFKEQWQPLLDAIKDKRLDLNLSKTEYIESHAKGRETAYGDTGCSDILKEQYGIRLKKQNGKPFQEKQIERVKAALDKTFCFYGNIKSLADKENIKLSYADNCMQYCMKAIGVWAPYENTIGVSFFDDAKQEKTAGINHTPDVTMIHETAHWLDALKGRETEYFFASDKEGTAENEIAKLYKSLVREKNSTRSSLGSAKPKKLGEYWYRTCECFARAMEQTYAYSQEIDLSKEAGYLSNDVFEKEILPKTNQLINENKKHFSLNKYNTVNKYKVYENNNGPFGTQITLLNIDEENNKMIELQMLSFPDKETAEKWCSVLNSYSSALENDEVIDMVQYCQDEFSPFYNKDIPSVDVIKEAMQKEKTFYDKCCSLITVENFEKDDSVPYDIVYHLENGKKYYAVYVGDSTGGEFSLYSDKEYESGKPEYELEEISCDMPSSMYFYNYKTEPELSLIRENKLKIVLTNMDYFRDLLKSKDIDFSDFDTNVQQPDTVVSESSDKSLPVDKNIFEAKYELHGIDENRKLYKMWGTTELGRFLDNPEPDENTINQFNKWLKEHNEDYLRLYHGTASSNDEDIQKNGIKKTTQTRRKSYQSTPGYVYLSRFPSTARTFGEMNNQSGKTTVYACDIKIKELSADLDQLNNKRSVGIDSDNSLAASLIIGNGARIGRVIKPYEISPVSFEEKNMNITSQNKVEEQEENFAEKSKNIILEELVSKRNCNREEASVILDKLYSLFSISEAVDRAHALRDVLGNGFENFKIGTVFPERGLSWKPGIEDLENVFGIYDKSINYHTVWDRLWAVTHSLPKEDVAHLIEWDYSTGKSAGNHIYTEGYVPLVNTKVKSNAQLFEDSEINKELFVVLYEGHYKKNGKWSYKRKFFDDPKKALDFYNDSPVPKGINNINNGFESSLSEPVKYLTELINEQNVNISEIKEEKQNMAKELEAEEEFLSREEPYKVVDAYSISTKSIYDNVIKRLDSEGYVCRTQLKLSEYRTPSFSELDEYIKENSKKYQPVIVLFDEYNDYDKTTNEYKIIKAWQIYDKESLEDGSYISLGKCKINYLNENLELEYKGPFVAPGSQITARSYYNSKGTRELCHVIKEADRNSEEYKIAVEKAASYIAEHIHKSRHTYLVPAPNHNGKAEYTYDIARSVGLKINAPVFNILECKPHETLYEQKKKELEPEVELFLNDYGKTVISNFPEGRNYIYLIDNCISTGLTFNKAAELINGLIPAVYAIGNFAEVKYVNEKYKVNNLLELKNEITHEENKNMAKEQKCIAKWVDKDGRVIDFERFSISDVKKIEKQCIELNTDTLVASKDTLVNFDFFKVFETEPDGTNERIKLTSPADLYLKSVSNLYKNKHGHLPTEDEYDAARWNEIMDKRTERLEQSVEKKEPFRFFVKDRAEFEMFADFEPVTNLTAHQAFKKLLELEDKGYSAGIGIHIPDDYIFDDPEGNGYIIFEKHNDEYSFYIGDNFVKELKHNENHPEHASNVINAYKALDSVVTNYRTTEEGKNLPYKEPLFLYEKEKELFGTKNIEKQDVISSENIKLNNISNDELDINLSQEPELVEHLVKNNILASETNWTVDKEKLEEIKKIDRSNRPGNSIWGKVDSCHKMIPGVYTVDTSGHGGIMVHESVASKILSKEALDCAELENGFYQYEEDVDAHIPLIELYKSHLCEGFSWNKDKQGKFFVLGQQSLAEYRPEYLAGFIIRHMAKNEIENVRNLINEQKLSEKPELNSSENVTEDESRKIKFFIYAVNEEKVAELKEHLKNNAYNVSWEEHRDDTMYYHFTADYDSFEEIKTILEDRNIDYEYMLGLLSTGYDAVWLEPEEQVDAEIVTEDEFKRINELREKEFNDLHLPYIKIDFTEGTDSKHKPANIHEGTVLGFKEGIELIDKLNKKFNTFLKADVRFHMWNEEAKDYVEYNPSFEFNDDKHTLENGKEVTRTQESIVEFVRMVCSYPEVLELFEKTWDNIYAPSVSQEQKDFVKELTQDSFNSLEKSYKKDFEELKTIVDEDKEIHSSWIIDAGVSKKSKEKVSQKQSDIASYFATSLEHMVTRVDMYLEDHPEMENKDEFTVYARQKIKDVMQNVKYNESRNAQYGEHGYTFDFSLWRKANEQILDSGDYDAEMDKIFALKEESRKQTMEYAQELKNSQYDFTALADLICQSAYEQSGSGFNYYMSFDVIASLAGKDETWVKENIHNICEALEEHNDELLLDFNEKDALSEDGEIDLNFCSVGEDENYLFKQNDDGRWVRRTDDELRIIEKEEGLDFGLPEENKKVALSLQKLFEKYKSEEKTYESDFVEYAELIDKQKLRKVSLVFPDATEFDLVGLNGEVIYKEGDVCNYFKEQDGTVLIHNVTRNLVFGMNESDYNTAVIETPQILKEGSTYSLSLKQLFSQLEQNNGLFFFNDKKCVSLSSGSYIEFKEHESKSPDNVYYDMYSKDGDLLCCDGETVAFRGYTENGLLKFECLSGDEKVFILSKEEFETATFTTGIQTEIAKENPVIDFAKNHVDLNKFLTAYHENYDLYYKDIEGETRNEQYLHTELFDFLMENSNTFKEFVSDVAMHRKDFFSSDRECSAFMRTFRDMGILREVHFSDYDNEKAADVLCVYSVLKPLEKDYTISYFSKEEALAVITGLRANDYEAEVDKGELCVLDPQLYEKYEVDLRTLIEHADNSAAQNIKAPSGKLLSEIYSELDKEFGKEPVTETKNAEKKLSKENPLSKITDNVSQIPVSQALEKAGFSELSDGTYELDGIKVSGSFTKSDKAEIRIEKSNGLSRTFNPESVSNKGIGIYELFNSFFKSGFLKEENCPNIKSFLETYTEDKTQSESIPPAPDFMQKENTKANRVELNLTPNGKNLSVKFEKILSTEERKTISEIGFAYSTISQSWKAEFNQENGNNLLLAIRTFWPGEYASSLKQMGELSQSAQKSLNLMKASGIQSDLPEQHPPVKRTDNRGDQMER